MDPDRDREFVLRAARGVTRLFLKPLLRGTTSLSRQRRSLTLIAKGLPPPRGTRCSPIDMNGVHAERVESATATNRSERSILFLHGGGYCIGSPASHRALTGQLARATGALVYAPDYRLAPEHPHPAALEDAVACYRWLLGNGYGADQIAIAGDSAGGGLTLCTALALRDAGTPLPSSLVLLSPWVDLETTGESMTRRAARDPMLTAEGLQRWARGYLAATPATHPLCSPLNADLAKLPPMLIQVGSEEVLFSDAERLHQRARAAGINSTFHEYAGLWHDFQLEAGILKSARAAVAEIGAFMARHWPDALGRRERCLRNTAPLSPGEGGA